MIIHKPSNKIIFLILVALSLVGLATYTKINSKSDLNNRDSNLASEDFNLGNPQYNSNLSNVDTLDSDGDGLPDWQEVITSTDPHNVDTDGDGTEDGKELELGRDPTIAGPDDKLDKPKTDSDLSADIQTDTTISEEVSKNLFANAVYLSNNDGITDENINTLVDNLIQGVQSDFIFKEYMLSNLPLIQRPTQDDLRFFASTLATLQMQLLNNLAVNTGPENISKVYNDYAQNLYELKTPLEIADTEIKIINNFSKVSAAFDVFSKQSEDPLKLPLAVRAYQEAADEQESLIIKIGEYLNKNGIIDLLDDNSRNYWTLSISQ